MCCKHSYFHDSLKKQSGKLIRQPEDFPQRGKSAYFSALSSPRGTMPVRLRMPSSSAYLTVLSSWIWGCFYDDLMQELSIAPPSFLFLNQGLVDHSFIRALNLLS